jgi:hypothetical protein
MKTYMGWVLLNSLPYGFCFDNKTGSPLHGYSFATNGRSVIHGQQRCLVRLVEPQLAIAFDEQKNKTPTPPTEVKKATQVIDEAYTRTVNELARACFKRRLLQDILVDLMICEIEGWVKSEYIKELQELITGIGLKSYAIEMVAL